MAVVEIRNQTVVWHQGAHKQGDLASKRDSGDSFNWDYMYYHMGHWVMAYIGPRHWHALPSNLSLREQLNSVLVGTIGLAIDAWVGLCRDFSHCLYLMWPFSFQLFHLPS